MYLKTLNFKGITCSYLTNQTSYLCQCVSLIDLRSFERPTHYLNQLNDRYSAPFAVRCVFYALLLLMVMVMVKMVVP